MKMNERIKKLLTTRRQTMSELAAFCGVTPQAVKQWVDENGTSPRGKRLQKIAEFFELSESDLQYGDIETLAAKAKHSANSIDEQQAVYYADAALFEKTKAPFHQEIEDVIKLMEATDSRGRVKIKLAAIDAFELHSRHIAKTITPDLSQEELELVKALRNSTEIGKSLIKTAIETAQNENTGATTKKTG